MFFSPHNELTAIWEGQPEVSSFPYWDNTDPPLDISDKAWENRGKLWLEATGGQTFAAQGFSCQLYGQYSFPRSPEPEDVIKDQPARALRIKEQVTALTHMYYAQINPDIQSGFWNWFKELKTWSKTEEGKKFNQSATQFVSKGLPQRVTRKSIMQTHNFLPLPSSKHPSTLKQIHPSSLGFNLAQADFKLLVEVLNATREHILSEAANHQEENPLLSAQIVEAAASLQSAETLFSNLKGSDARATPIPPFDFSPILGKG